MDGGLRRLLVRDRAHPYRRVTADTSVLADTPALAVTTSEWRVSDGRASEPLGV